MILSEHPKTNCTSIVKDDEYRVVQRDALIIIEDRRDFESAAFKSRAKKILKEL